MKQCVLSLFAFVLCVTVIYVAGDPLLSHPRWAMRHLLNSTDIEPEKSFFEKIKEFYDDPNNLAMYGVLPMIVLVYGGFCVIYCVCKGYDDCKKKKTKKAKKKLLRDEDEDEMIGANTSDNNNVTKNGNNNRNNMDGDNRGMTRAAAAGAIAKSNSQPQHHQQRHVGRTAASASDVKLAVERENTTPLPWAIPDEDALYPTKEKTHFDPPPAQNPAPVQEPKLNLKPLTVKQPDKPYRPPNRKPHPDMHMPPSPPPPYDFGRRDSVEEISMNPRRVNAVSNRSNDPRKAMNAMEQYALARQAAQLLRVENGQMGPGGKKPKRLVFVAE